MASLPSTNDIQETQGSTQSKSEDALTHSVSEGQLQTPKRSNNFTSLTTKTSLSTPTRKFNSPATTPSKSTPTTRQSSSPAPQQRSPRQHTATGARAQFVAPPAPKGPPPSGVYEVFRRTHLVSGKAGDAVHMGAWPKLFDERGSAIELRPDKKFTIRRRQTLLNRENDDECEGFNLTGEGRWDIVSRPNGVVVRISGKLKEEHVAQCFEGGVFLRELSFVDIPTNSFVAPGYNSTGHWVRVRDARYAPPRRHSSIHRISEVANQKTGTRALSCGITPQTRSRARRGTGFCVGVLLKHPEVRREFASLCFAKFDLDENKLLELNELQQLVVSLCECGKNVTPPDPTKVQAVMRELDVFNTGGLDLSEFDVFLLRILKKIERDSKAGEYADLTNAIILQQQD